MMIEFRTEKPSVTINRDGTVNVTFTTSKAFLEDYDNIGNDALLVSIKDYKQRRSVSQNAYMWVLLGELSHKLGISRNNLYRSYIRDYGVSDYVAVRNASLDAFISGWGKNGIGYFAESMRDSKVDGCTTVVLYYGSSCYDSTAMSRLIEPIVRDCKEQGISTMTYEDIMLLKNDNN